jgi:hypothetical protein
MRTHCVVLCLLVALVGGAAVAGEAEAPKKGEGPILHSVYFWLKDEATEEDVAALVQDCKDALGSLECVEKLEVGVPAGKGRGVVDASYHVGLVVTFADQAAYDTYLPHPKHQGLVKKHKPLWKKVVVYDVLVK